MKTKYILGFIFSLLVAGVNATNTVIKTTDVQTLVGTLNVSIEQCNNGVYDLLIKEPTKHASNVFMTDFPFGESREEFDEACKEAYIALFKTYYPEICKQIIDGTIRQVCLSINFDDRKEFVNKNFWVNVKSKDLAVVEAVVAQLTGDSRLFTLIKEGSEQVYGKVSMTPRTALSAEMKQLVDSGEKGYFSNAYIKICKENL